MPLWVITCDTEGKLGDYKDYLSTSTRVSSTRVSLWTSVLHIDGGDGACYDGGKQWHDDCNHYDGGDGEFHGDNEHFDDGADYYFNDEAELYHQDEHDGKHFADDY